MARKRNREDEHRREVADLNSKLLQAEERASGYERDYRRLVQRALEDGSESQASEGITV